MAAQPQTRKQLKRIKADLNYIDQAYTRNNVGKIFTTNDELRRIIIKYGLVEHRISPYEALQRAIDDATIDYMIIRKKVDRESNGPSDIFDHPNYDQMLQARETMVRYATYAIQYDIISRQQKITETRVALLGHALQATLQELGVDYDKIQKAPSMLIDKLGQADRKLDTKKAEALVEILHNDAEVEIKDQDTS